MTSAQHLAPHATAHPSSGTEFGAGASRILAALLRPAARARRSIHAGDALAAAGYTVMSAYAAGLVAYIATVY
ncbi:MAG: hypothetical protein KF765_06790 [Parvibaculaceae bacterium]|nr:hypothetical protein [Parvibaculaceae bacterium]